MLPTKLITDCIQELQEKGILTEVSVNESFQKVYKVSDPRNQLKNFICQKLYETQQVASLQEIYVWIKENYGSFFSKEYIFTQIDALFQDGKIMEMGQLKYKIHD